MTVPDFTVGEVMVDLRAPSVAGAQLAELVRGSDAAGALAAASAAGTAALRRPDGWPATSDA